MTKTSQSSRRILAIIALAAAAAAPAIAQRSDTVVVRADTPRFPKGGALIREAGAHIGGAQSDFEFTNAFVFAGPDSSVIVVDLADPNNVGDFRSTVRQYDKTGRFLRVIGGKGRGPGEFPSGVGAVATLPNGGIILSHANGINVYTPDGKPVAQWAARLKGGFIGSDLQVDPAGFVFARGSRPAQTIRKTLSGQEIRFEDFLYRFRFDGSLVDSVAPPDHAAPFHAVMPGYHFAPFASAWSPLGYWLTTPLRTYTIDRQPSLTGSDRRIHSIRRRASPVPVTTAERSDWKKTLTLAMQTMTRSESWQWSGPDIPQTKPAIRQLVVTNGGQIWAKISQPATLNPEIVIPDRPQPDGGWSLHAQYRWVEPAVFDVFEPGGQLLGEVRFPEQIGHRDMTRNAFVVIGDVVWAVVYDADEVPRVRRYRLRWNR